MKKSIFLLCALCCSLFLTALSAPARDVSKQDALAIAQRQFSGQDVDYLCIGDCNPAEYIFCH